MKYKDIQLKLPIINIEMFIAVIKQLNYNSRLESITKIRDNRYLIQQF